MASDRSGDLYVADLNNFRIVVFDASGTFVKALSTALGGKTISRLRVAFRQNASSAPETASTTTLARSVTPKFLLPNAENNSTPTGWATGVLASDEYCAFDKKNNFFVDGTALPHSRINAPSNDVLSVGASVSNSTVEKAKNYRATGPGLGPLSFAPLPAYTLSGYPTLTKTLDQVAPSSGGAAGTVCVADYGVSAMLAAPANGGTVSSYASLGGTVGVATIPTGQY